MSRFKSTAWQSFTCVLQNQDAEYFAQKVSSPLYAFSVNSPESHYSDFFHQRSFACS